MKKTLFVALIGITIGGIGFGLLTPVTVILLEKSGASSWVTGFSITLGYLSVVLFSPATAKLIDDFNIKPVLMAGMLIWMLGCLGHIFWYNYYVLFPVRLFTGIGGTFIFVGTEVLINKCSNDSNRGKNIGLYAVLLSVGIAIGTLLIYTVEINDWVPFVVGSIIMAAAFIFQFKFLQDIPAVNRNIKRPEFKLKNMPFLSLVSASLYGVFESSIIVALPLYGLRSGFSEIEVSNFLTSFVIGGIVILFYLGKLSDTTTKRKVLIYVSISLSLLFIIPSVTFNFYLLLAVFFLIGGIIPAYYTVGLSYTIEKINSTFIAPANGYFTMMYGLGTLLGPVMGSMMIEINVQYGYWLLASILCFFFFRIFTTSSRFISVNKKYRR